MNANLTDTMSALVAELRAVGAVSDAGRIGRAVAIAEVTGAARPAPAPYDWSPRAAPNWRRVG